MSLTRYDVIGEAEDKGFVRAWKGMCDLGKTTGSIALNSLTTVCKSVISPVLCNRPDEIILDSLHYSIPMFSHTNACINYIKRRIRHVVFFNHGQQGTISFTINPRDSWMLNMKKVDIALVVSEINEWLSKDAKDAKDIKNVKEAKEAKFSHWPKSIQWREASLLRSKVNHGDHFLVHYYETLTPHNN